MLKQLKRQYHNIFKIGAVSPWPLLRNGLTFPFRYKFNLDSKPVNIIWDITYRCNLNCHYCFFAVSRPLKKEVELPTEKIIKFVSQVAKYKPSFYFTGGEPLLRPDLEKIIAAIRANKMKVGLNTNATLMTRERLLSMDKAGLNYIIVSLDPNKETTDKARGAGVYDKALQTIKMAKEMNLRVRLTVNCVVDETNFQYLDGFLDMIETLNVDALKLSFVHFSAGAEIKNHVADCARRLGIDANWAPDCFQKEIPGFGEEIAAKIRSLMPKIKRMKTPVSFNPNLSEKETVNWFNSAKPLNRKCLFIFNVVRLSPNGDIYPCQLVNHPVGNITQGDFLKIYNNQFYKTLRREFKKAPFPACLRCNKQ
ncbi:MAG: radical SAM protein [Candidatus Portnoybacteria bacterium]|nr:radical SAM protein [Candidatus Portnoybacteria bacterium]MDD4982484.1 radical SAM protein [Candidatus Portnoybacteria bacterium]